MTVRGSDGERSERLSGGDGRQRPPLEPALAGAALPGRRRVRGRTDSRPPLPRARVWSASASWCSGSAIRASTSPSSPRGSPRRPSSQCAAAPTSAEVPERKPVDEYRRGRLDLPISVRRFFAGAASRSPSARCGLRAAEARPQALRGAPDRLLGGPAAGGHGDIEVKANIDRFSGGRTVASPTAARRRSTSSSTARVTRSPFRSSPRKSSPPPTTACRSTGGSPRPSGALLPWVRAAARPDHADRRGAGGMAGRSAQREGDATVAGEMRPRSRLRRWLEQRFVASRRHTIEVDFHPYLREIRRERKRVAQRG